jgi:hypothetical protein
MNPSRTLSIVLQLQDQASQQLRGFQGSLKDLEPTFRQIRNVSAVAFGAITATTAVTVKAAADAEVAWTKFNVVFGDSAEDMRQFVSQVRADIPLAERQIAKMTAGLGDMLVPMGFARHEAAEMSKQFVQTAAGVAAFNNVDPSEVLNAIQSGLAGNSMALRRFGVEVSKTRLENIMLRDGLAGSAEELRNMDVMARRNIEAQAILTAFMEDSSDAVAGLEKEKETLAFKMRDAAASMQEVREAIGDALIPAVTAAFNTVRPFLDTLLEWIRENPTLVRNVIIVAGALAGLALVGTTLLLAILPIIAAIKTAAVVFGAFAAVLAFIMSPIGLVIGAVALLAAGAVYLWRNYEPLRNAFESLWNGIVRIFEWARDKITGVMDGIIERAQRAIQLAQRAMELAGGGFSAVRGAVSSGISRITPFANGGIVTSPTLGMVGEAGPEAIIPLSKMGSMGGGVTIIVNGDVSGTELIERVKSGIMQELGHNIRLTST